MLTPATGTETEQGKKGRSRPVALGRVNLLLAILGLLFLAGAYWINFLPEAFALSSSSSPLVTVISRVWHARRGGSSTGSFVIPSAVNCDPVCCSV